MRDLDQILLENVYLETTTKSSVAEFKYYFDEVFDNSADEFKIEDSSQRLNHPKFDKVNFSFIYKGTKFVKVFSSPGENSSKSNSGSLAVSIFVFHDQKAKQYDIKETNAFFNQNTKQVDYDPVLRNSLDVLRYVKSVLDRNDRDKDVEYDPPTPSPVSKKFNKKQPVLV